MTVKEINYNSLYGCQACGLLLQGPKCLCCGKESNLSLRYFSSDSKLDTKLCIFPRIIRK